jgi:hypothetical protein
VIQRIQKWLLFVCATMMLAACSADTVAGPAAVDVFRHAPAVSPRTQNAVSAPASPDAEGSVTAPRSSFPQAPAAQRGRGRYAMAAS